MREYIMRQNPENIKPFHLLLTLLKDVHAFMLASSKIMAAHGGVNSIYFHAYPLHCATLPRGGLIIISPWIFCKNNAVV